MKSLIRWSIARPVLGFQVRLATAFMTGRNAGRRYLKRLSVRVVETATIDRTFSLAMSFLLSYDQSHNLSCSWLQPVATPISTRDQNSHQSHQTLMPWSQIAYDVSAAPLRRIFPQFLARIVQFYGAGKAAAAIIGAAAATASWRPCAIVSRCMSCSLAMSARFKDHLAVNLAMPARLNSYRAFVSLLPCKHLATTFFCISNLAVRCQQFCDCVHKYLKLPCDGILLDGNCPPWASHKISCWRRLFVT